MCGTCNAQLSVQTNAHTVLLFEVVGHTPSRGEWAKLRRQGFLEPWQAGVSPRRGKHALCCSLARVAASLEKVRQASGGSAVPNASHGAR